jgi:hypothetical protein
MKAVMETPIREDAAETAATDFHEQVARLAYALWQERGCPEGTPEVDWFQAEQQLRVEVPTGGRRNKVAA